jgi:hypothetical protein
LLQLKSMSFESVGRNRGCSGLCAVHNRGSK